MVIQSLNGIEYKLGKPYDMSFINKYGEVFRVFERRSGNICFGTEKAGKRYFLKFAGAEVANPDGKITVEMAIATLKATVTKYKDLKHPLLINQIDAQEVGGGFLTVFDWFDGESYGYPQTEMCKRFLALPVKEKQRVFEGIMEYHAHVAECGYVAVDFNDQNTLYNFDSGDFAICDIDFYVKGSYINDGNIPGACLLMSPEEDEERVGEVVDEISNVYAMGGLAFIYFAVNYIFSAENDKSRNKWTLSNALYDVAIRAISESRHGRQQSIRSLIAEWKAADRV